MRPGGTQQFRVVSLRPRAGQSTIEYFLLFTVMAMLTILGFTTFDNQVRTLLVNFFQSAATKVAQ